LVRGRGKCPEDLGKCLQDCERGKSALARLGEGKISSAGLG